MVNGRPFPLSSIILLIFPGSANVSCHSTWYLSCGVSKIILPLIMPVSVRARFFSPPCALIAFCRIARGSWHSRGLVIHETRMITMKSFMKQSSEGANLVFLIHIYRLIQMGHGLAPDCRIAKANGFVHSHVFQKQAKHYHSIPFSPKYLSGYQFDFFGGQIISVTNIL